MRPTTATLGAMAVFAVLAAGGCATADRSRVSIGVSPWPGYELVYVASEQGYFADEGLHVHLAELLSPSETRRAYERGQVDVWCAPASDVVLAQAQSLRSPRVVSVLDLSHSPAVLLADRDVRDVRALRHQRVAVDPAALDVIALRSQLARGGLGSRDVELVGVQPGHLGDAFGSGSVRAATTTASIARELLASSPRLRVLLDGTETDDVNLDVLVMDARFIVEHEHEAFGILRALRRARGYVADHPDRARRAMAVREHVSDVALDSALHHVHGFHSGDQEELLAPGGVAESTLARAARELAEFGITDSVLDTAPLLHRRLARTLEGVR